MAAGAHIVRLYTACMGSCVQVAVGAPVRGLLSAADPHDLHACIVSGSDAEWAVIKNLQRCANVRAALNKARMKAGSTASCSREHRLMREQFRAALCRRHHMLRNEPALHCTCKLEFMLVQE